MYKFNFNLHEWKDKKVAMHCPEEWQAKLFCKFLDENGRRWFASGKRFSEQTHWVVFGNQTCYDFNCNRYDCVGSCKALGYKILEISNYIECVKQ